VHQPEFSLKEIASTINEIFSFKGNYSSFTQDFIDLKIYLFLVHAFNVMLLSIVLGSLSYWIIRGFKLDIRFKILRFKNQWYYVFSGEINSFKKFKNVRSSFIKEIEKDNRYKYYPPQVEVVMQNGSEEQKYVGFLVDYDLSYENINDLDKLYLRRAAKVTKANDKKEEKNFFSGDVFVLKADNIVSLNLTFIPSPQGINSEKKYKQQKKTTLYWVYNIGRAINIIIFLLIIFMNIDIVKKVIPEWLEFLANYSWYQRLSISIPINLIFSLLLPIAVLEKDENQKNTRYLYKGKDFKEALLGKIILFVVTSILVYYLIL
jgi:hypothetical protein